MNGFHKWKAKTFQWEFWPFWFFYIPVYFYYLWLSIREGSLLFFTATNPSMEFGGMAGEKKSEIFNLMPKNSYAKTILITTENKSELVHLASEIGFPLIAKPNIGERGLGVAVIDSAERLAKYSTNTPVDFLIQEFVTYPIELGIFYVRTPSEKNGKITSIVMKKFLGVIGNGKNTVRELLRDQLRANLQLDTEHPRFAKLLEQIPAEGEEVVVEPIGNHCRGTMFLDATHEADTQLNAAIDGLAKQINGFYYGRFDLKCASIDDLRKLENYKVVELNGVGAEPGHIYNPGFSLFEGYRIVMWHFNQMAKIARQNKRNGISYWSLHNGVKKMLDIRAYNSRLRHL